MGAILWPKTTPSASSVWVPSSRRGKNKQRLIEFKCVELNDVQDVEPLTPSCPLVNELMTIMLCVRATASHIGSLCKGLPLSWYPSAAWSWFFFWCLKKPCTNIHPINIFNNSNSNTTYVTQPFKTGLTIRNSCCFDLVCALFTTQYHCWCSIGGLTVLNK